MARSFLSVFSLAQRNVGYAAGVPVPRSWRELRRPKVEMSTELLTTLEQYYDAVPRPAARVEEWPPFVLFVQRGAGWPYYARPALGATEFAAADVARVRARQRELRVPEAFEWVAETTPAL